MIKKIHYVWLGGKPLPAAVKSCMKSWRLHCPDWEIIEWNEHNFPIGKYKYVKEAIEKKKYAFASDFIRLWALWHVGGYIVILMSQSCVESKNQLTMILSVA